MPSPPIHAYIKETAAIHGSGDSTEHSFRGALQKLMQELLPGVRITNEPRRVACGAPDYVLTRNQIPLGYIEAKNIDKSLDDSAHKEQLRRYVESLDNLIFTNYLEFHFYRNNEKKPVAEVAIAELRGGKIAPLPENFAKFADLIENFGAYRGQTITAADDLAKRMADKARLLAQTIGSALDTDENNGGDGRTSELQGQLKAFRELLDAGIKPHRFAGIYAQTIAYGMFVARLHDSRPAAFTRHEAARLIPGSNPFLQKFFGYIADYQLDERIRWIVDDLVDIFRATDVGELMKDFGRTTQRTDPFMHFYETFLGAYDAKLRKSRGVWYTPEPVVNFIVRAVDEILKKEFGLSGGLADTTKATVTVNGKKRQIHKVQILDPGTGTGTFLAEVVRNIHAKFSKQKGAWPGYVKNDLLPRLNGFEILMAPYAMAHVKLEMILGESGFKLDGQRLRLFLTNSLENREAETKMPEIPFANWLVDEARGADEIKRDVPVMVVMGNPPYAVSSSNIGRWIETLMEIYKEGLHETNIQPLSDDYVKFIRYGQFLVEKTGEGILAYISNNSFIDGLIHRQARRRLLDAFDRIYILDLHGNSTRKETCPDGSPDKNVFDIKQGVSINIFVKSGKKKANALGEVFHCDLYGARQSKYEFLWGRDIGKVKFRKLKTNPPYFFFVPKDFSARPAYKNGFGVNDLFSVFNSGIQTKRDALFINSSEGALTDGIKKLLSDNMEDDFISEYNIKDSSGYKLTRVIRGVKYNSDFITDIDYRPFDAQRIYYDNRIIGRSSYKVMRHFLAGDNLGLVTVRQVAEDTFNHVLVAKNIVDMRITTSNKGTGYFFPLYLYPDEKQTNIGGETSRQPNLNADIVKQIADKIGLTFTPEKTTARNTFAPMDVLDYIYATLHSPTYRAKFREFLKIDFPRVPYPRDKKQFRALAKLGAELRALHLMENAKLNKLSTTYPQTGDNTVSAVKFNTGKVHLNKTQYFGGVPQTAWEFYIGGYQPAQKYLKDRKGRTLSWDEINHYQKIIVALTETARVMEKIDKVI